MKKLFLLLLVCALGLCACGQSTPAEEPAESPAPTEEPSPAPTEEPEEPEEPVEAIRPRLILDGCTPGEAEGLRLEVTDFDEETGNISFKVENSGAEACVLEGVALKVETDGDWQELSLPGSMGSQRITVEPGRSVSGHLTLGGVDFDAGEYLFSLGELEAGFWLVYTE